MATLFRSGLGREMRLFETEERDVVMAREYYIPLPARGARGVRVEFGGGEKR